MKARIGVLCVAAAVLLSPTSCFAEWELTSIDFDNPLKYELLPEGTLQDPNGNLRFSHDAVLDYSGDEITMLSPAGEVVVKGLNDIYYLGGGLYQVRTPLEEDNVNKTGFYTSDGEALISEECAKIVQPDNKNDNGDARFYCLLYTTEKTDNESEAIIYFTDDMFSMSVAEDDILYKGYGKIYDVERKQFVPDLEFSNITRYGFYDLGDSFVIDDGSKCTMYDADGKELWSSNAYLAGCTYHALAVSSDGKYYIVNSQGKDVYSSDKSINVASEPQDYFSIYDGEEGYRYHLIDMEGNYIMDKPLHIAYSTWGNLVRTTDEDDKGFVLDFDGNIVAENVSGLYYYFGGYGNIQFKDKDTVAVVTPTGVIDDLEDYYGSKFLYGKDGKVICVNTGEFLGDEFTAENMHALLPGLASFKTGGSSGAYYGVIDVLNGETLLAPEYDDIKVAGEYLYGKKSSSSGQKNWDVFKIKVLPVE